jgi:hypothetical protein
VSWSDEKKENPKHTIFHPNQQQEQKPQQEQQQRNLPLYGANPKPE